MPTTSTTRAPTLRGPIDSEQNCHAITGHSPPARIAAARSRTSVNAMTTIRYQSRLIGCGKRLKKPRLMTTSSVCRHGVASATYGWPARSSPRGRGSRRAWWRPQRSAAPAPRTRPPTDRPAGHRRVLHPASIDSSPDRDGRDRRPPAPRPIERRGYAPENCDAGRRPRRGRGRRRASGRAQPSIAWQLLSRLVLVHDDARLKDPCR